MESLIKQSKAVASMLTKVVEKALDVHLRKEKRHSRPHITHADHVDHSQHVTIHFETSSVIRATLAIIGVLLLFYFLYTVQQVLVLLFVSLILSAAISPLVDHMEEYGIHRAWGVLVIFTGLSILLGMVVYSVIPIIVKQIITLSGNIGNLIEGISNGHVKFPFQASIQPFIDSFVQGGDVKNAIQQAEKVLSSVGDQLGQIAGNSVAALASLFNGLFNACLVVFLVFFMVTDKYAIQDFIYSLIPSRYAQSFEDKAHKMQLKIGSWIRGQILNCIITGLLVYFGLWSFELFGISIPYKETLAILAGTMEIIPYIGQIFSFLTAILIAANTSFTAVIALAILYLAIQFIQNNFISPIVMNKEVGLNPIIIIVAILVGAQFFGVVGIALAIPVATSLSVFVEDYIEREKKDDQLF